MKSSMLLWIYFVFSRLAIFVHHLHVMHFQVDSVCLNMATFLIHIIAAIAIAVAF